MARLTNVVTTVYDGSGSYTTIASSAWSTTFTQVIDIQQAVSGVIHFKFKMTTAPGSLKSFSVYAALCDSDSGNFDTVDDLNQANKLGDVLVSNDTTDDYMTLIVDPSKLAAKYMKVYVYNGTGQELRIGLVKTSIRIPV